MSTETNTQGNPAVVGLAGFGISTLLLQFHNLGWCGVGPVFALAIVFGGLAQLIAGFQEFKCGNNFGYCAFVGYGAFWLCFGLILICNHMGIYQSNTTDVGWFLIGFTVFSLILWVPAMRIHGMMALTFTLVVIGFILLDLAHFGYPQLTKFAAYDLILCALSALYMMASAIYNQVFGRVVLPLGAPWIKDQKAEEQAISGGEMPEAA